MTKAQRNKGHDESKGAASKGKFSVALLWNRANLEQSLRVQAVIISIPGQETRCLRHPECWELILGAARDSGLHIVPCVCMERQKEQR